MSIILRPEIPVQKTPQLTLLAAVAIVQAIEEQTGIAAEIKWPNDILINGKKVVGILTELQAEADQVHSVIVGTGINVNQLAADFPEELQETATSLRLASGEKIDRAALVQTIMSTFEKRYEDYLAYGFEPIKLLWESYALTLNRELTARTLNGTFHGKALGIDEEGVLILETSDGIKKYTPLISILIRHSWNDPCVFGILRMGSILWELHLESMQLIKKQSALIQKGLGQRDDSCRTRTIRNPSPCRKVFCCPKRCRCKHGSSSPLKKRRRKHEDKN